MFTWCWQILSRGWNSGTSERTRDDSATYNDHTMSRLRRLTQRSIARNADVRALAMLAMVSAVTLWNRFAFDSWLARLDISTFLLPWYIHLGERLRSLDLPGWNPHLFSGTPFAGDPQSGWMYLPAMLAFVISPSAVGFKLMVAIQAIVAVGGLYAFTRVLGMRPIAALIAATMYLTGPFLHWNTYCCTIFGQFATWVPMMLLGVELALRSRQWGSRWLWWLVAGFALSQIFASWLGQGAVFALLLLGSYVVYRACFPDHACARWRGRLVVAVVTGCAVVALGAAFGAGGLWPRFEINAVSNLAGGDYSALGPSGADNPPWTTSRLMMQLLGNAQEERESALGGATVVLALLAPMLARRRFATPYFAALTVVALLLTQQTTPLHRLLFLIPRFRVLYEHDPWRVYALAALGPPLLAGAAVEALASVRWPWRKGVCAVLPVVLMVSAAYIIHGWSRIGWMPVTAAAMTTALVLVALRTTSPRVTRLLPAAMLVVAVAHPAGFEWTGSWLGWPVNRSWVRHWHPPRWLEEGFRTEMMRHPAAGAAAFLQAELRASGPFRYAGYGGVEEGSETHLPASYLALRYDPHIQALLVNARPMFLGLYDIQGYDPIQLVRYVALMRAVNERPQNYHTANLLVSGTASPLLDLLDVRYVVIDRSLPPDRPDVRALTESRKRVYQDGRVAIYERVPNPRHAWIVHEVQQASQDEALAQLASGAVDPFRTALVETPMALPPGARPVDPAQESARIVTYRPDEITIDVTTPAPGLLVLSEIYAPGWSATVRGQAAAVVPVDGALRGVPIPEGRSVVRLVYRPLSLGLGTAISAASMLAFLITSVIAGHRLARRTPGASR